MEKEKVKTEGRKFHAASLRLIKFINVVLMTMPFAAGGMFYYAERTDAPFFAKGNYVFLFSCIYSVHINVG